MGGLFLLNELPDIAVLGGREYPARTDFRVGVLHEQVMRDDDLDDDERIGLLLGLYFGEELAKDAGEGRLGAALEWIAWFYSCGDYDPRRVLRPGAKASKPVYSLDHDGGLIYAAFLGQYGIDLHREKLHWWKFNALLEGLAEDCRFMQVVGYRAADAGGIPKEQKERRAFIKKMKRLYALPSREKVIEREMAMERALWGG